MILVRFLHRGMGTMNNEFRFEVQQVTEENRFDLMARVEPFHGQLKLDRGRFLAELYNNVSPGAEAVFITTTDPDPRDVACVVERLKTINLGGHEHKVLMRYLRAVAPDYQRRGIGTALTDEPVNRLEPDAITGRTPNPYVFRADELSPRIGTIHPIHKLHTPRTRILLVATLDPKSIAEADSITGRCRGVYPKGENRLFSLEGASERVLEIYRRMIGPEVGVVLDEGDGIRYLENVVHHPRGRERLTLAVA